MGPPHRSMPAMVDAVYVATPSAMVATLAVSRYTSRGSNIVSTKWIFHFQYTDHRQAQQQQA